jgi:hypothetical protein
MPRVSGAPRSILRSRIVVAALALAPLVVLQAAPPAHAAWSTAGILDGPIDGAEAATGSEAARAGGASRDEAASNAAGACVAGVLTVCLVA